MCHPKRKILGDREFFVFSNPVVMIPLGAFQHHGQIKSSGREAGEPSAGELLLHSLHPEHAAEMSAPCIGCCMEPHCKGRMGRCGSGAQQANEERRCVRMVADLSNKQTHKQTSKQANKQTYLLFVFTLLYNR